MIFQKEKKKYYDTKFIPLTQLHNCIMKKLKKKKKGKRNSLYPRKTSHYNQTRSFRIKGEPDNNLIIRLKNAKAFLCGHGIYQIISSAKAVVKHPI